MTKKKKTRVSFEKTFIALTVLLFLLVAIAVTTSLVQQRQSLSGLASETIGGCRKVPAGNYNVKVKTDAPTPWEVTCGKKRWSGELPATTIPFGNRRVSTIRKGDRYTLNTTLKEVCSPSVGPLEVGWDDVCQVCQYIDCSKTNINGSLTVKGINCLLEAYQVEGGGDIKLAYRGGLGCSAKATYKGKLMGIFLVGPAPKPTPTPTPVPRPTPTPTTCQKLWWFDDTHRYCSKKTFCGFYMYKGLRTFGTEKECKAALGG